MCILAMILVAATFGAAMPQNTKSELKLFELEAQNTVLKAKVTDPGETADEIPQVAEVIPAPNLKKPTLKTLFNSINTPQSNGPSYGDPFLELESNPTTDSDGTPMPSPDVSDVVQVEDVLNGKDTGVY
eukprot:CAMPEP_0119308514 /NCGR_PEP_ID=MMETSP1333-20130426/11510_1 /TAXON_ID=418940 /ORGANISM="Scyphosphaera apsteinii, Strain RCC1455" /LENGTH=128 /DNA_ID=CAMNT_0007312311 /DNA_START=109 /DNA_END=492 /DNA_ORIENTATION=-